MVKFIFKGVTGTVDQFGFICWNGMGFGQGCASREMQAVVNAAVAAAKK